MEVSFNIKGQLSEVVFSLIEERENYVLRTNNEEVSSILLDIDEENYTFLMHPQYIAMLEESESIIKERLANLYREWVEHQNVGLDVEDNSMKPYTDAITNYSYNDIYVENKPFSIWQLVDYIDKKILNVNPDFQRNFIWDMGRQSRLIESILLGLPLPAIYLNQFEDGTLAVVDGLQRISTIYSFMKNRLRLNNLEYLHNCENCVYSELENKLSPLIYRMFDQTAIMCFVIDRRSPIQLKYDLFKRLNTGGVPLNNQEIRNCLSKSALQRTLRRMVESNAFSKTTSNSINNYRMDAQEMALRFMYFYDEFLPSKMTGSYSGNLDFALNKKVDELNKKNDFTNYINAFEQALEHAYTLFGDYSFRKILPNDTRKRRINKSLFVAITVILAKEGAKYYRDKNIVTELSNLLDKDVNLFNAITWSTTSVANVEYVMMSVQKLFDKTILR